MAQHTKQPEMLRELFEALGNDPFVIAECLARPVLTEIAEDIVNRRGPASRAHYQKTPQEVRRSYLCLPISGGLIRALMIRGQPPARPTRPVPGQAIRQCGLAVK